jgi:hypothetical protein
MSIFHHKKWLILGLSLLTGIYAEAQQTGAVTNRAPNPTPGMMPGPRQPQPIQTPTYLADYFVPATKDVSVPDEKGFIRRWMLLETHYVTLTAPIQYSPTAT